MTSLIEKGGAQVPAGLRDPTTSCTAMILYNVRHQVQASMAPGPFDTQRPVWR